MEEPLKDLSRLPDQEIDKALFALYQEDASAFTAIYERFSPELLVFIEAHLEGVLRSDAEDILHDTFMAFYKMRDRLEPNTKLRGLLYRIAERRLNDRLRAALAQKRCVSKTEHRGPALHDKSLLLFHDMFVRQYDPRWGDDEARSKNVERLRASPIGLSPFVSLGIVGTTATRAEGGRPGLDDHNGGQNLSCCGTEGSGQSLSPLQFLRELPR